MRCKLCGYNRFQEVITFKLSPRFESQNIIKMWVCDRCKHRHSTIDFKEESKSPVETPSE